MAEDAQHKATPILLLRRALDEAVDALPVEMRTNSFKTCLAAALLRLAAGGEADVTKLREQAVAEVLQSCRNCHACDHDAAAPLPSLPATDSVGAAADPGPAGGGAGTPGRGETSP